MSKSVHILNGDALKDQFPKSIEGEIIVARECLIDGDLTGSDLNEFYQIRASFISTAFDGFSMGDYYEKTVSEFDKIQKTPAGSELNLWFEDDLFCQVNLWFVLKLIKENVGNPFVYLVRPNPDNKYNFGAMNGEELERAFQNRTKIQSAELTELSQLWMFYHANDLQALTEIAERLKSRFPFLLPAVLAHKDRIPQNGIPGKPIQTLIQILNDHQTTDFTSIFREFSQREAIYGFGDLQVKRMLDQIKNENL